MKKLIALIAVLGFVPYAHAADGADFSHSGEFRIQYTNDMNADVNEDVADSPDHAVHQRLKWGTQVRAGEKMTANFTLLHNADWGMNSDQVPDGYTDFNNDGVVDAAELNEANSLTVLEAYMTWMASDAWTFLVGRGSLTMADGRFISANEFNNVPKAYDGVTAMWNTEMAMFGFSHVRAADFSNTGFTAQKNSGVYVNGVSADFKTLPSFLKGAHAHIFQIKMDDVDPILAKSTALRIGTSVNGEVAGLDWRLNYEMEDGETEDVGATPAKNDIKTSMMDAEVGYAMPEMMNSRFHVGYHTDSGTSSGTDRETYDSFHYDQHNNAGLMDFLGWGNLTYMRLGAKMAPADDITVGVEYLKFTQTEKADGSYKPSVRAGLPGSAAFVDNNAEDDLGAEIDLWIAKKYTNNFNISARYSMFQAGDEFGSNADDYNQFYVESKLTF